MGKKLKKKTPTKKKTSLKNLALIPIVGNNTERGGESVLSDQTILFNFILRNIYATSVK